MANETSNLDEFVDQEEIFGQGEAFRIPLLPGLSSDDQEAVISAYGAWLANSTFADRVAFLDITFAPVGAQEVSPDVYSLILSPDAETVKTYSDLLSTFLGAGNSIAAHPEFRKGLPASISNAQRDRFLLWVDNSQSASPLSELPLPLSGETRVRSPERPFEGSITRTYKNIGVVSAQGTTFARGASIGERWSSYITLLSAHRGRIRSQSLGDDGELGVIGAAPLGVRNRKRPDDFIWIADIFFGLNRRSRRDTALSFLRFVFLQLLRNNASVRGSQITEEALIATIGHEVKRVTGMIGGDWTPPAASLFHISVAASPSTSEQTLGRIELNKEFEFLQNTLYIAPFGDLLRTARKTIDQWAFANLAEDLPLGLRSGDDEGKRRNRAPTNWRDLILFTWQEALDQVIMYSMTSRPASRPSDIIERQLEINQLRDLFQKQSPVVTFDTGVERREQEWDYYNNRQVAKDILGIARVLMAWFGNCVENATLRSPISVSIGLVEGMPRRLALMIRNASRGPDETLPAYARLKSGITTDGPHTKDVIELSLRQLNGKLIDIRPDEATQEWLLRCEFDWSLSNG